MDSNPRFPLPPQGAQEKSAGDSRSPVVVAIAGLWRPRGPSCEVLLTRRPAGVHLEGLWELPGGKVEPGESVEGALRRELLEEIGFSPPQFEPLTVTEHDYADRTVRLHAMIARVSDGDTVRNLGVTAHRWVPLQSLSTYDWPQANTPIAAALARRLGGLELRD